MSEVFLISDTHFFHEGVLRFEPAARPFATVEEMNEVLVDRWNKTVGKRDTVWHLGDVCFGHVRNLQIIKRLNGHKNLTLGNHDNYDIRAYADLFNKIEAVKKYDDYLLSHIPIHPGQFYRFKGNVHGHLHSKLVTLAYDVGDLRDLRYVNVSCEHTGLAPVSWDNVKKRFDQ